MRGVLAPALALLGLAATPASALDVPADHGCMGRWVGRGQNTGYTSYWTIDLTLTAAPSGGRCGTIEYTNPDCGGTLERCELVGQDIHTREVYTHAESSCAPAGRVIIRCEGDRMRYSWIGWERVDTVLHRPEGAPRSASSPEAPPGPTPTPPTPTPTPAEPRPPATPSGGPPAPPPVTPSQGPPAQPSGGCGALGCDAASGGTAPWPLALALLVVVKRLRIRSRGLGVAYSPGVPDEGSSVPWKASARAGRSATG